MPQDNRSSQEIERDLERHRQAVAATIDQIETRLTPRHLTHDLLDSLGAVDSSNAFVRAVQRNPLPLLIAGLSIGWLVIDLFRQSAPPAAYSPRRLPALRDDSALPVPTTAMTEAPEELPPVRPTAV